MLEVLGGAWKKGPVVITHKRGCLRQLRMPKGERVSRADIASVELLTQDHVKSMAGKAGWGVAGGFLLGGIGAVAGLLAGGEKHRMTVLFTHGDGRQALLRGRTDDIHLLLAATMDSPADDEVSTKSVPNLAVIAVLGVVALLFAGALSLDDPMEQAVRERERLQQNALSGGQAHQQRELRAQLAAAKARDRKVEITDTMILEAIEGSDDFEQNRDAFLKASRLFMENGGSLASLREVGGWVRSPTYKPRQVYFTYRLPGNHVSHRFYYDVDTGKLFQ